MGARALQGYDPDGDTAVWGRSRVPPPSPPPPHPHEGSCGLGGGNAALGYCDAEPAIMGFILLGSTPFAATSLSDGSRSPIDVWGGWTQQSGGGEGGGGAAEP